MPSFEEVRAAFPVLERYAYLNAGTNGPLPRAAAEATYSTEWREHVAKLFGSAPEITWFDTPVIVDNAALASKAA